MDQQPPQQPQQPFLPKKLPAKPLSPPPPLKKLPGGLPPSPAAMNNGLPPPPAAAMNNNLPPPPVLNNLPPPPNNLPPPPMNLPPPPMNLQPPPSIITPGPPPPSSQGAPPLSQGPPRQGPPSLQGPPPSSQGVPRQGPPPQLPNQMNKPLFKPPPPQNKISGNLPPPPATATAPLPTTNLNLNQNNTPPLPTPPPPLSVPPSLPTHGSSGSLSNPSIRQSVYGIAPLSNPPPPLQVPPTPLSPTAATRQAHLSGSHNRASSQDSAINTSGGGSNFRNSTDSVALSLLDQPEIYPQTRIAEENFNYLKEIHTKITKRSQTSSSCSREGNSLAETFKNYGTMLISQSDNLLGQCMYKVGDFQREYEEIRDQLDIQSLSGLKGTIDQFINRDVKVVRASRKNFDKIKSMYETVDTKVNSNANKGKGVNLVKQAELQQERDFLRGKLNQVGQDSLSTIKLANESNSVEIMEQMVEYMENMQVAVKALQSQLAQLQVPITTYKKEAVRRRAELEKSIEQQKNINSQKNQKDKNFNDELDREVQGEDPKKTRLRRFISAERNYVGGLNSLVNIYLSGLRTDDRLFSKIFKEDEVAIFSNIEPLYSYQTKFLEELESSYKGFGEVTTPTLGGVFFKNSEKMMKLYSVYINNFSKALLTINRCKHSKNFQAFLKTCEEKADGADLDSLIPLPLTRVANYLLLLNDMKDQFTQQQSDPTELKHVLGALEKIQSISECVKQSQNIIQLNKLQQSLTGFDGSLVEEGRFLVKEGTMSILFSNIQQQPTQFYFLLLTDILIYCKKQNNIFGDLSSDARGMLTGQLSQQASNKYKFIGKFDLKNMDIKNITDMDSSNSNNSFQILCGGGINCTMFCETKQQKEEWLTTITKTISKCNQNKLFGIPLEAIMARPFEQGRPIPSFLQRIVDYLYDTAPLEEGIFRLSANQKTLDMGREEIETGVELDYNEMDIHAVAGILKLWVRNLPEPLLTFKYFDTFVDIADLETKDEKYQMIKNVVEKLPNENKFSTYYLMKLLTKVSENSAGNKMTPNNISIVFATLLLRKKDASPLDCTSFNTIFGVIECFMTGFNVIFNEIEKQYQDALNSSTDSYKDKRKSVIPNKPLPNRPPHLQSPDASKLPPSGGGSGSGSINSSSDSLDNSSGSIEWTKQNFNDSDSDDDDDEEGGFSIGSKQASITIQLGEIVKQGYLTKKGAMRRNWTKRWFVLKQGYLFYFKTSKDKKPKGIIQLNNVSVTRSYYKPNCMAIKSNSIDKDDREFLICANSQNDLESWIKVILNCITQ
ncbi:hypothetical protein DICPUDRAFT_86690 [Dictyostelium purpureum]|uniref:RhoGEF domain-containing protein n=1 Tax=Dictyostelium purpureum TaxID=5786 RepID=F0ZDA6_DICPU|nr:uncharacterized protein DICPUDRAFT_86690 [Dictyostelium purpureum]EGC38074.1 hypothetical protein DICPUDRAFT_86690 [Dictyostelium purpureum]|eukprot:XP_003285381.1 hypothetical protein DICPUDRAFT_86690 [Dictyostelium purpureum]